MDGDRHVDVIAVRLFIAIPTASNSVIHLVENVGSSVEYNLWHEADHIVLFFARRRQHCQLIQPPIRVVLLQEMDAECPVAKPIAVILAWCDSARQTYSLVMDYVNHTATNFL